MRTPYFRDLLTIMYILYLSESWFCYFQNHDLISFFPLHIMTIRKMLSWQSYMWSRKWFCPYLNIEPKSQKSIHNAKRDFIFYFLGFHSFFSISWSIFLRNTLMTIVHLWNRKWFWPYLNIVPKSQKSIHNAKRNFLFYFLGFHSFFLYIMINYS